MFHLLLYPTCAGKLLEVVGCIQESLANISLLRQAAQKLLDWCTSAAGIPR